MADTKISGLAAASTLDGTELVEVVQDGTNKKVAVDGLLGAVQEFTPVLDTASGAAPTYELADEAGVWGAPSFGKYALQGAKAEWCFRLVALELSPGTGAIVFETPTPIDPAVGFPGQAAHLVQIDDDASDVNRISGKLVMDAVWDPTRPVMMVDGAGDFLDGTVNVTGSFPLTLDQDIVIFAADGSYWRDLT